MATAAKEKTPREIELETEILDLKAQLETQTKAVDSLNSELSLVAGMVTEDYELTLVNPVADLMIYDGVQDTPQRFVYHESISFKNEMGWSPTSIRDWGMSAVDRAFQGIESADGQNRLGYVRQTVNGKHVESCQYLPPFRKNLRLEVIVRIVDKGA